MTDHYSKSCEIEPIIPLSVSAATEIFTKSVISQMSVLCIDHITEQLSKSYMDKYNVVMSGRDRDGLRQLAVNKFIEYLTAECDAIRSRNTVESIDQAATEIAG